MEGSMHREQTQTEPVSYSNARLRIIGRHAEPLGLHRGQFCFSPCSHPSAFSFPHLIQHRPLAHTTTTLQSAPFIHSCLAGAPIHPIKNNIVCPVASFLSPLSSSADGYASYWAEIEAPGERRLRGPMLRLLRARQTVLQYNVPLSRA
jgi:hypothetical protein